jgi:hypothetical protein
MLYHGYLKTHSALPVPNMLCFTRCVDDVEGERQEVFIKESWFSLSDDFYLSSMSEQDSLGRRLKCLESVNLEMSIVICEREWVICEREWVICEREWL